MTYTVQAIVIDPYNKTVKDEPLVVGRDNVDNFPLTKKELYGERLAFRISLTGGLDSEVSKGFRLSFKDHAYLGRGAIVFHRTAKEKWSAEEVSKMVTWVSKDTDWR